jgi:hypothetical protein
VLLCAAMAAAQDAPSAPENHPAHPDSFFSGTVVEVAAGSLTVSRTILGKPAEKRTFILNGDTRIDGKLTTKIRVTVRYASREEGDVAVSVLVRGKPDKKK